MKERNKKNFSIAIMSLLMNERRNLIQQLPKPTDGWYRVFLSIGNENERAKVLIYQSPQSYQHALKILKTDLEKKMSKVIKEWHFLKIDFVYSVESIQFRELERVIANTRKNYFRKGIAFDPTFNIAFLEQEINGNALIRENENNILSLNEKNIRHYLKHRLQKSIFNLPRDKEKEVYLFNTIGFFYEKERNGRGKWIELLGGKLTNGIRKVENLKDETFKLIKESTYFLSKQIKESGQFEYGYFSAFGKPIQTYNILRHASSLYSLLEGYAVLKDRKILKNAEKALEYLISEALVYKNEQTAYMVDIANDFEIKLGSNATAILAITKYTEVTNDFKYLSYAQKLANGIIDMKDTSNGKFQHVLSYPSFKVKEKFRIIYYEGEAIFALLRLYKLDQNKIWLDEVRNSFDIFIREEYWKYNDHWLSYAVNELTDIEVKDKYYLFGLKNCHSKLDFIYHRETTFPTFLELTMAAYQMVIKIKKQNRTYLFQEFSPNKLLNTIQKRVEYQRVGFMYPELAMYFKYPKLIRGGFFIRHHSFRVRIDDVEHNLSGYIQYYEIFKCKE